MWQEIYFWSKRLHKWVMWVMIVLGSGMMMGGLLLHKEVGGEPVVGQEIMRQVRYLHNLMAVPFALVLGIMMFTGLSMWLVPKIMKNKTQ